MIIYFTYSIFESVSVVKKILHITSKLLCPWIHNVVIRILFPICFRNCFEANSPSVIFERFLHAQAILNSSFIKLLFFLSCCNLSEWCLRIAIICGSVNWRMLTGTCYLPGVLSIYQAGNLPSSTHDLISDCGVIWKHNDTKCRNLRFTYPINEPLSLRRLFSIIRAIFSVWRYTQCLTLLAASNSPESGPREHL